MRVPKFTDKDKFLRPYVDAKASAEPGYLARRFEEIREEQKRIASEQALKVKAIQRRTG